MLAELRGAAGALGAQRRAHRDSRLRGEQPTTRHEQGSGRPTPYRRSLSGSSKAILVDNDYFVSDGRKRVAAVRAAATEFVDAQVTEIRSPDRIDATVERESSF
jgi:hypothetical protein